MKISQAYSDTFKYWMLILALAACNYLGASLGKMMAIPPGNITPVWPPSGIAFAAVLIYGYRIWPGILLGSFIFNVVFFAQDHVQMGMPEVFCSLAIALGSTVQAIGAGYFSKKFLGYNADKWDLGVFQKTILLGGPIASSIAASIGTGSLHLLGELPARDWLNAWVTWWFGDAAGVLLITSLILSIRHQLHLKSEHKGLLADHRNHPYLWHLISGMMMLTVLGGTLWGWEIIRSHTDTENRIHFNKLVSDGESNIKNRLLSYQDLLHGGTGLFYASESVEESEWNRYVSALDLEQRYPGLMGIGYSAYVANENLPQFLKNARRNVNPDYHVQPVGNDKTPYKDKFLSMYFSPSTPKHHHYGRDIGTEPHRRAAAEHARDDGEARITGIIHLLTDKEQLPGFLLMLPIYKTHNVPPTVEARRAAIQGWIVAPFRGKYAFADVLPREKSEIAMAIYDGNVDPANLIYNGIPKTTEQPLLKTSHSFKLWGRSWTIVWASTPYFHTSSSGDQSGIVLIFGLSTTILLGGLLMSLNTTRMRAIEMATSATQNLRETARRYEAIFNQSFQFIGLMSPDGILLDANRSALTTWGLDPETVLGKPFHETPWWTHSKELQQQILDAIHQANQGEFVRFETHHPMPDGKNIIVDFSIKPVFGDDGKVILLIPEGRDITERQQAEERFRVLFECSSDPHLLFDAPNIIDCNEAAMRLLNCTKEDLMSMHPAMMSPEYQPDGRLSAEKGKEMEALAYKNGFHRFDWIHRKKSGEDLPVEVTLTAVQLGGKDILLVVWHDLTERKQMEGDLRDAKEEALRALRLKSEFLANMSHEIRTPMNGILGLTEMLMKTSLADDQRKYMQMVYSSGRSLLTIINDILDFSKIEAGKLMLEETNFKLRDFIEESLYPFKQQADDKGLSFLYSVDLEVPNYLVGDPTRLRQVMNNLVSNAIKFTARGDIYLNIALVSESEKGCELKFSVCDTGIGLHPDKLHLIFEPFTQADGATSRQYGGTGLGLSISAQLVKMMNGSLHVDSKMGQGSTFTFTAQLGLQPKNIDHGETTNLQTLSGLPILVVDDDPIALKAFCEVLEKYDLKPTTVSDGHQALEAIRKLHVAGQPFPLVLSDICMTENMDGFALVEAIRQDPELKDTKIILCTSWGEVDDRSRCHELQVNAYLTKPVSPYDLMDTISQVMETPAEGTQWETTGRLLLAEDNEINQVVASNVLEKAGYTVRIANNGSEAVQLYQDESFDLILMDIHMPEMDGFEATQAIRELEKETDTHIPIVALTANAIKGDREHCLAMGMDSYISKPFQAAELLSTLQTLLRKNKPQSLITAADSKVDEKLFVKPAPPSQKIEIDRDKVLERLGGNMILLDKVVTMFRENYHDQLAGIQEAIDLKNHTLLQERAHALKGTIGNFTTNTPFKAAFRLERMGRENDLEDAEEAYNKLTAEVTSLEGALIQLAKGAE